MDGYRAIGVKTSRETILYSRNHKNFNNRFPQIVDALGSLPADTVIDGEVVVLDESGRPDFHGLPFCVRAASQFTSARLFQLRILGFGLLEDRDVEVGVFPKREEIQQALRALPLSPYIE